METPSTKAVRSSTTVSAQAESSTKPTKVSTKHPFASLLEGSEPDNDSSECSFRQGTWLDPAMTPIGTERKQLGNIRRLFGYFPDSTYDSRVRADFTVNAMQDVLFLSLDISQDSYDSLSMSFDIGVSVLDTRHISHLVSTDKYKVKDAMAAVQSYHFRVGQHPGCQPMKTGRFRFGRSAHIGHEELPNSIDDIVRDRDYVLVVSNGHSYFEDFQYWLIDPRFDALCTINLVDSYNMAIGTSHADLHGLMAAMQLPFTDIDHPGNAAHYNLRALMSLVSMDANMNKRLPIGSPLIRVIGFLARSPEALTTLNGHDWLEKFTVSHTKAVVDRKKEARKAHRYCTCRFFNADCL